VVVQVNSHQLSLKAFSQKLAVNIRNLDALTVQNPELLAVIKTQLVDQFILESLVADATQQAKISLSDEEFQVEFKRVLAQYPDDLSFRNALIQESLSLSQFKDDLRRRMLSEKFFQSLYRDLPEISDRDVEAYYKENPHRFRLGERIFIRQIVVKDLTRAMEVLEQLKRRKSFEELAEKFSQTPEASEKGEVGWIEKGSLEFFDQFFSAPLNQPQGPIESLYGFHIVRVEKKAPAGQRPIREVEALIKAQIKAAQEEGRFKTWLERQIRMSIIRKDQKLIDSVIAVPKMERG
jgi:peptidyl-prolyl cis-trans isomerase C